MNKNEHFKKYQNLLRKRSWQVAKTWNTEFEEVYQSACLLYCEALLEHDESISSFSTFLMYKLKSPLEYQFARVVQKKKEKMFYENNSYNENYEKINFTKNALSKDCLFVMENLQNVGGNGTKDGLYNFLRFFKWTDGRINRVIREIKEKKEIILTAF